MPVWRPKVRDRRVTGRVEFGSWSPPLAWSSGHSPDTARPTTHLGVSSRDFRKALSGPGTSGSRVHEGLRNWKRGGLVHSLKSWSQVAVLDRGLARWEGNRGIGYPALTFERSGHHSRHHLWR